MCGFAGILTTAGYADDELTDHARRMIAPIAHRGPDDSGIWTDQDAGIAFGFRRLAIIDLSADGHQPMQSASGRFVLVFNGEIYNFKELRRELEPYGYPFVGHSDTEVILAALDRWGVRETVGRLSGMFALAIWDTRRRELSLSRDRLGKKPLYVYSEPGLVTFGSELKALIAGPSFDRSIDRSALASYLRYLCVQAPHSIYRHARKLPAAHIQTISDARVPPPESHAYWSLSDVARRGLEQPFSGSDVEAVDELDSLLQDSVGRRMVADVPLGALLSGGVDSSTVVALMQEASRRPVKTYTIGFDDVAFNEARHATEVARHLGTDHTELQVTGADAQALVPRLSEVFDEPFANPSQLPTLLLCQLARRQVTVALCGDGGDELFGGYNRYVFGTGLLPRASRIPRMVRRPMAAAIGSIAPTTWDRLSSLTTLTAAGSQQRVGERMHKLSDLLGAESVGGMYQSLLSAWQRPASLLMDGDDSEDLTRQILDGTTPSHLLDRMMLADQTTYLPDDSLAKMDRASMSCGLEIRAPLLDHRIVEFSWRLPRSLKLRGTVGKWALRQVLYRRVPPSMIERPKMGFSVPIDRWLRGPLREWAESLLLSKDVESDGLLDRPTVIRTWNNLQEGRRPAGLALWAVIMFQAWRARWVT